MKASDFEQSLYGDKVKILKRQDNMTIYQIEDSTGSVEMISYEVFSGISLIYNNVHMQSVDAIINPPKDYFEINHCSEGRIESEFEDGEYFYISKGDFSVHKKDGRFENSYFPISHYHGITIAIEPSIAQNAIDKKLGENSINLLNIYKTLCNNCNFFIKRGDEIIEAMFLELYNIPPQIKKQYFKLKVLEILLYMSTLKSEKVDNRGYYSRSQVEKVKAIEKKITSSLHHKYTLEQLSLEFDISLTTMKKCFKGVFGSSIYSYLKSYKMNKAANMLLKSDYTILQIANILGYENGSKFASAFRSVIGVSPKEFRKEKNIMSF